MPPRQQLTCLVCQRQASRYTCASCRISYCSVACYKQHKETCLIQLPGSTPITGAATPLFQPGRELESEPEPESNTVPESAAESVSGHHPTPAEPLQDPTPLRPLTSLKWPYVPDTSTYPDPLTRDDPKPIQLHQYEAIATSPTIRTIFKSNPRLCDLLTSIDALRGSEREEALQRALGVDGRFLKNDNVEKPVSEDTRAFRELAEAVEIAVRGGREDVLGLDWD